MAKQRYIDTKFWDDEFITELDPNEKLLFIYFLTNPLTNIAGIYEISLKRVVFDTGISSEEIVAILQKFADRGRIHYLYGWVIIPNFPKYQNYHSSPKIKQGIELIIKDLPTFVLETIHTLSIPYKYPLNYTNTNTNTNTNTVFDENSESKKFLNHYFERYSKCVGGRLPVVVERIILPKIEETAGLFGGYEKLRSLLEIYFAEDSKFYRENKWSLTCFLSPNILNKLND